MTVLAACIACYLAGALGPLLAWRSPARASLFGMLGTIAGSACGLSAALMALVSGAAHTVQLQWDVPTGVVALGFDPLSAFFLVPVCVLSALAAVYGRSYWAAWSDRRSMAPPWFFFNVFVGSMVLVIAARDAVVFLLAWETMSLASFFLVTFEHDKPECARAGWVYLIATHAGMAALIAMFVVLAHRAGGFEFAAASAMAHPSVGFVSWVLLLAMLGFGIKAGYVPLHVWLPEAHAAAPSHVSALMSGVMVKMGLYGIVRIASLFRVAPGWWGPALMTLGIASALVGILLALYQRDMKRALAYSSIENVGIITVGLGLGYWGYASGHLNVAVFGLAGALLHVWNHAAMKGLMFLCAGSVLHGTGTQDLERLGGLMKTMPRTSLAMMLGAVAISALPPVNGFVSEWLIYRGLLCEGVDNEGVGGLGALMTIGALAMVGAMTCLSFVRLTGIALLGTARSPEAEHARESPTGMTTPLWILAAVCVTAALVPGVLLRLVGTVVGQLFAGAIHHEHGLDLGEVRDAATTVSAVNLAVGGAIGLVALAWRRWMSLRKQQSRATWGCGYVGLPARTQYSARSFAELMTERLFPTRLGPRVVSTRPLEIFPKQTELASRTDDPFTRGVYEPVFSRSADWLAKLHWLQQGFLQVYIVYVLAVVILALTWASFGTGWN